MTEKEELLSIAKRLEAIAESLSGEKETITIEELRRKLVSVSRVSKDNQAAIKQILKNHGANTLSELNEAEYEDVLEEVMRLE